MPQCYLGDIPSENPIQVNLDDYTIFSDSNWNDAVKEIWVSINTNDCQCNIFAPWNLFKRIVSTEQVDSVLTSYMNVINDTELPEYCAENTCLEKYAKEYAELISKVADASGVQAEMTLRILNQLYWSTKQGRIKTTKILNPRKTNSNSEQFKNPGTIGQVFSGTKNLISGVATGVSSTATALGRVAENLPLLIGGIAILGIVYYGSQAYKNIKGNSK